MGLLGSARAGRAAGTKAKQNTKAKSLAAQGLGQALLEETPASLEELSRHLCSISALISKTNTTEQTFDCKEQ